MKKDNLNKWVRLLIATSSVALIVVIFVPIWRIDLDAPQYPEGLQMFIHANKLAGQVDIINGLNHYIGMKTLHAEDFIEFTVLPYIIGFYALLFLIVAIVNKKKYAYILLVLFAIFGILAMVDFWRWEYDYGHNLDPNAAIIVPGMSYQPPLIGFKQLLNFGAYSVPAIGGWIFIIVGAVLLASVITEIALTQKQKKSNVISTVAILLFTSLLFTSCSAQPKAIKLGVDQCYYCKMKVSDARFPAEIITQKGKVFIFDDLKCTVEFIKENTEISSQIKDIYASDYSGNNSLVNIKNAHFYSSADLRSPMSGNIASFENIDSLTLLMKDKTGQQVEWNNILK